MSSKLFLKASRSVHPVKTHSFCYYQSRFGIPGSDMRRTHSESELQDLLSSPPPSSGEAFPFLKGSTSMTDDFDSRAITPTPDHISLDSRVESPPPTSAGLLETESGLSTRVRCWLPSKFQAGRHLDSEDSTDPRQTIYLAGSCGFCLCIEQLHEVKEHVLVYIIV